MNSFSSPAAPSGANSPTSMLNAEGRSVCRSRSETRYAFSRIPGYAPVGLTDAQREEAIQRAGELIERYMARWESDGCMAARGDADRARRLMELLIAGRSPEQVARMEKTRGLDRAGAANE